MSAVDNGKQSGDDFEYTSFFTDFIRSEVFYCEDIVDLATAVHYLKSNGFSYDTIAEEVREHMDLYKEAVRCGEIMAQMAEGMRDGIHVGSDDWAERTDTVPIKTDAEYAEQFKAKLVRGL